MIPLTGGTETPRKRGNSVSPGQHRVQSQAATEFNSPPSDNELAVTFHAPLYPEPASSPPASPSPSAGTARSVASRSATSQLSAGFKRPRQATASTGSRRAEPGVSQMPMGIGFSPLTPNLDSPLFSLVSPLSPNPLESPPLSARRLAAHGVTSQPVLGFALSQRPRQAGSRSLPIRSTRSSRLIPSEEDSEPENENRRVPFDEQDFELRSGDEVDTEDENAEEPEKRLNVVGMTPSRRSGISINNEPVRKRVTEADPHHAVCLLTNAREPASASQFCHIVPRSTSPDILTVLEWWWQMKYWTLYIDTRFNIVVLMSQWHLPMDADDWVLVPTGDLIAELEKWSGKSPTEERKPISESYGERKVFDYYVLPLSKAMEEVVLHRCPNSSDPKATVSHFHPFSTIGPLSSHLHPHFVVYSAGQKLHKLTKDLNDLDAQAVLNNLAGVASFGHKSDPFVSLERKNKRSLQTIQEIYDLWSTVVGVPAPGDEWRKSEEEDKYKATQKEKEEKKRAEEKEKWQKEEAAQAEAAKGAGAEAGKAKAKSNDKGKGKQKDAAQAEAAKDKGKGKEREREEGKGEKAAN